MNVYLIGLPGSGKTTAARELSRLLSKVFLDTDQEIEKRTGIAVAEIFDTEGEGAFRELESLILAESHAEAGALVATGGGLPATGDNMERMLVQGLVVWLDTPVSTCAERIVASGAPYRPMFKGMDRGQVEGRLHELLTQRQAVYGQADIIVRDPFVLSKIASLIRRPDALRPLY